MKTIKRERQVRLDELLKHVWDGEIIGEKFYDQENNVLFIDKEDGEISQADHTCKNDLFTITEEVEVTGDTKLNLAEIYTENGGILEVEFHRDTSVNELLEINEDLNCDTQFIQVLNPDGSIGELIWSKERGLVD